MTIFEAGPITVVIGASFVPKHEKEEVPSKNNNKDCNIKKQESHKDATTATA